MNIDFKNFKFPEYKDVKKLNQIFLDRQLYKGYNINMPANDLGLYILIDCQNNSVINMGDDIIRFAWCNRGGFAVASVSYKNCEEGYLMGCAFLLDAATEMIRCFETFLNNNTEDLLSRLEDITI